MAAPGNSNTANHDRIQRCEAAEASHAQSLSIESLFAHEGPDRRADAGRVRPPSSFPRRATNNGMAHRSPALGGIPIRDEVVFMHASSSGTPLIPRQPWVKLLVRPRRSVAYC